MLPPKDLRCTDSTCPKERKWIVEQPGQTKTFPVCSRHLPRFVGEIINVQRVAGSLSPVAIVRDLGEP